MSMGALFLVAPGFLGTGAGTGRGAWSERSLLVSAELSSKLGLFGSGSGLGFEKLSGFNRVGRRSKIEIDSE